ncbi:hypothetical protein MRS76_03495 [Rhizobiaceae bacterium n13]|nr:hypothetical protein [Fererhizobium litorale]MDI7861010.1 hypothetical protein [Fererhizobium litorale]
MKQFVVMTAMAYLLAGCATSGGGDGPTVKCDTYIQSNADAGTMCY